MLLLKAPRDALLAPLQAVSGVVEKRHTLPILSNVLIEKSGDRLTFTATDIEIQIRTITTGNASGEDAAITVGARKLQDILRALPDTEVSLALEERRLTVKAGRSRFQLQTLPADEYPLLTPPASEAARFSVPQRILKQQLALVAYAMAQQDIRYYLNGLLLIADGGTLTLVTTDGHRLAYATCGLEAPVDSRSEAILPRKTILELSRQIGDNDDPVDIVLAGNQAVFRFGSVEFVTKLIDGKFPDYQRVIPQDHPGCIALPRVPLLSALQRAAILSNEKFHGVRMVLDNSILSIISSNTEQEEAQEEIEVDFHGERLDIGFNVGYLLDVLNNVSSENIEWRFRDGDSSALITLPGNDSFKYVVMPMRI
ncbi:MAG: DNA polymerase III subunit beta [Azoarcus sp.]|jgi:DNA polymerase-3 subunit beta|nr:DNA polymerase III subunit beta [Azoarcus sp.]